LVYSILSIILSYCFPSHPPHQQLLIPVLMFCISQIIYHDIFISCHCFSFPKFHSVVPLLQTMFVSVHTFTFWIYLAYMRKNMYPLSFWTFLHLAWCFQLYPITLNPHCIFFIMAL
jgi:hypothetical protein